MLWTKAVMEKGLYSHSFFTELPDIHVKHKVFHGCLNCRSTGVLSRSISVFFLSRLEKVPRYFWYRVSLFSVFSFSYVRNTRLLRYRSTTDKTNLPAAACSKLPLLRKTNNRDVVRQCATHKKKGHGDPGCTDLWILWVFKFSVVNTPVEIITVYSIPDECIVRTIKFE